MGYVRVNALLFEFSCAHNNSHISAILGYKGKGNDTDMIAFLVQPNSENVAGFYIWWNDGLEWKVELNSYVPNLPLTAKMSVDLFESKVTVKINNEIIFVSALNKPIFREKNSGLGIRWMMASRGW